MTEHFGTRPKKGRGMAKNSIALIKAMHDIAEAAQPITGRGVGYKLFTKNLIPSMSRKDMRVVYRLLLIAREEGTIPWEWIVDETRSPERVATWDDPEAYSRTMAGAYRRDFWNQQPIRAEVWSEKGTVRGVLQPILDKYQVTFRVMHGFSGATTVYDVAQDGDDGRDMVALYVGDWDPSGMFMSEMDLPERLKKYNGSHVDVRRVALTGEQTLNLPSFPAADKKNDPRYRWFINRHGDRCWELDAMDPNDLRDCVGAAIKKLIEPEAWVRCETINAEERESIRSIVERWSRPQGEWSDPVV
jgi:hypothetical protein